MVAYQSIRYRLKNQMIEKSIVSWLIIRFVSEVISYFVTFQFESNTTPVFHLSVLFEGSFIVWFFYELNKSIKYFLLYLMIPILSFYLEIKYPGSIYKSNGISFMVYNILSALLMLKLLWNYEKIKEFSRPIVIALFIFHSVTFVYSIIENEIRNNYGLMQIVYPVFLFSIVCFNLYVAYYLWSARRN